MSHIATDEDLEFEWKLNYEFLSAVQSQLSDYEDRPSMEEIEYILIQAGIHTTTPAGYNRDSDEALGKSLAVYDAPADGYEPDFVGFANTMLTAVWESGSFSGSDIQEIAEDNCLLEQVEATESCGEHCGCAEHGFPIICFRKTYAQPPQGESK